MENNPYRRPSIPENCPAEHETHAIRGRTYLRAVVAGAITGVVLGATGPTVVREVGEVFDTASDEGTSQAELGQTAAQDHSRPNKPRRHKNTHSPSPSATPNNQTELVPLPQESDDEPKDDEPKSPVSEDTEPKGLTMFKMATYNFETIKNAAWPGRIVKSTSNILYEKPDIVGGQEMSRTPLYKMVKDRLGDEYDFYPKPEFKSGKRHVPHMDSIMWRKDTFEKVGDDMIRFPRISHTGHGSHGRKIGPFNEGYAPLVYLRHRKTNQIIAVLNTHNAAYGNFARDRFRANKIYINAVREARKVGIENYGQHIPVFLTGDFNEGPGVRDTGNKTLHGDYDKLLYCMLAQNGLMRDATVSGSMTCPNKSPGGVDHIYYTYNTPSVRVSGSKEIGPPQSGSDHPARFASFLISRQRNR